MTLNLQPPSQLSAEVMCATTLDYAVWVIKSSTSCVLGKYLYPLSCISRLDCGFDWKHLSPAVTGPQSLEVEVSVGVILSIWVGTNEVLATRNPPSL